ncbi:MAG: DUF4143 domain-containing protein [Methanobrevibacter sp.]|uniref:ATP-binding protein n=1 Tax=Methanobrevibacter sp. TaxID=66852 RepID=UPI002E78850C|nr:DUF4143 domain-containing protein [Methanobrevibacter sp.]MEE0935624.1 DUF4143 domain-containing protein [Methanobrevibacter sp.]
MKKYLKRYLDAELEELLEYMGAVLIIGPKWCGKTTTAKQHSKSIVQLQDPTNSNNYLKLAKLNPLLLLDGEKPRLIDEWQMAPELWDAVRYSVDESDDDGLYILTGSTVVDNSKIMHSGAGRIHRLLMRPMSLYESGESNGKINLMDLFDNPDLEITGIFSELTVPDLIFAMCRGGWPESLNKKTKKQQLMIARSYLDILTQVDVSSIDGVKRNPDKVKALLKSYSRNISSFVKNTTIIGDIQEHHGTMSEKTYYDYINVLKQLFVIDETVAWGPKIRSKTAMRNSSKKSFIDPSIAVASLELTPEELLYNLEFAGQIFENLCIRDINVYSACRGGKVLQYHDQDGLEVDCVLVMGNGDYALMEIKLGSDEEDDAASNLLKLNDLICERKKSGEINIPEPKFLAIITGGEMAYVREDGVKVIPIGCLS